MITKNYNETTRTFLSALFFILLSAGLLTACQSGDKRDPTMDGFLIKDRQTTAMMKDQKVWFSEIKTKDPTMASVLDSVARQDWDGSISQAKIVLRSQPFNSLCFLVLATAWAGKNEWEKARFFARKILQNRSDYVEAMNILGLYKLTDAKTMADYRSAIAWFTKAFQGNSTEVASGLNLGYLYLDLGDHSKAEQVFSQAYKRCDRCSAGALGLGIALSRMGQYQDARKKFEQVVKQNPESMTGWYQLALLTRNHEKNFEKSTEYLKNILENPNIQDTELLEKARIVWYANRNSEVQ